MFSRLPMFGGGDPPVLTVRLVHKRSAFDVPLDAHATFGELRYEAKSLTGLPMDAFKLLYRGRERADSDPLLLAGIKNGAMVQVVETLAYQEQIRNAAAGVQRSQQAPQRSPPPQTQQPSPKIQPAALPRQGLGSGAPASADPAPGRWNPAIPPPSTANAAAAAAGGSGGIAAAAATGGGSPSPLQQVPPPLPQQSPQPQPQWQAHFPAASAAPATSFTTAGIGPQQGGAAAASAAARPREDGFDPAFPPPKRAAGDPSIPLQWQQLPQQPTQPAAQQSPQQQAPHQQSSGQQQRHSSGPPTGPQPPHMSTAAQAQQQQWPPIGPQAMPPSQGQDPAAAQDPEAALQQQLMGRIAAVQHELDGLAQQVDDLTAGGAAPPTEHAAGAARHKHAVLLLELLTRVMLTLDGIRAPDGSATPAEVRVARKAAVLRAQQLVDRVEACKAAA